MLTDYTKRLKHPYLGEVNEAFGLSLLVINQTTPLVSVFNRSTPLVSGN